MVSMVLSPERNLSRKRLCVCQTRRAKAFGDSAVERGGEAFFRIPLTPTLPIPRLNRMEHLGGCHCGNIHVRLRLSNRPEDNPLRACTCSFCRSHSPRMVADLEGLFEVWRMIGRLSRTTAPERAPVIF